MSDETPVEHFYLKIPRLEKEIGTMVQKLGERDTEIDRLREALGAVVVACDEKGHCQVMKDIRKIALKAMERSGKNGG